MGAGEGDHRLAGPIPALRCRQAGRRSAEHLEVQLPFRYPVLAQPAQERLQKGRGAAEEILGLSAHQRTDQGQVHIALAVVIPLILRIRSAVGVVHREVGIVGLQTGHFLPEGMETAIPRAMHEQQPPAGIPEGRGLHHGHHRGDAHAVADQHGRRGALQVEHEGPAGRADVDDAPFLHLIVQEEGGQAGGHVEILRGRLPLDRDPVTPSRTPPRARVVGEGIGAEHGLGLARNLQPQGEELARQEGRNGKAIHRLEVEGGDLLALLQLAHHLEGSPVRPAGLAGRGRHRGRSRPPALQDQARDRSKSGAGQGEGEGGSGAVFSSRRRERKEERAGAEGQDDAGRHAGRHSGQDAGGVHCS